jgi:hypothetical protein
MSNAHKIIEFAVDLQSKVDAGKLKDLSTKNQKVVKEAALAFKVCGKVMVQVDLLLNDRINEKVFEGNMKAIEKEMDNQLKMDK